MNKFPLNIPIYGLAGVISRKYYVIFPLKYLSLCVRLKYNSFAILSNHCERKYF